MKVVEFTGGLNTKIDPSLLPGNMSIELVNADLASGVLKAMQDKADTAAYTGVLAKFIQHKGSIISSNDVDVGYTEYANDLYYMKSSTLTQLRNGIEYTVGLPKPINTLAVSGTDQAASPTSVVSTTLYSDIFVTGTPAAGDLPPATYDYRYVYSNDSSVEYRTVDLQLAIILPDTSKTLDPLSNTNYNDSFTADVYRKYLGVYRLVGSTPLGSSAISIQDTVLDISANLATVTSLPNGKLTVSKEYTYDVVEFDIVNSVKVYSKIFTHTVTAGITTTHLVIAVADPTRTEIHRTFLDPVTLLATKYQLAYFSDVLGFIDYIDDPIYPIVQTVDRPNGTYQYVYTYYNSVTGYESVPSSVSDNVIVFNGIVYLTNISTIAEATDIRIYRVGGELTVFTLVDTKTIGTSTYVDSLGDVDISGALLISNDYDFPPTSLTLLTESNGVLLGAIGARLRFSKQSILFAWPVENFIDFKSSITCITEVANGIVVATATKTFIITGNTPAAYSKYVVSGEQGCQYAASYQKLKNGVILKSSTALMFTGGGVPELLSEKSFNPLNIFIKASTVHNNTYYAVGSSDIFVYDLTNNNYYTIGIVCDNIGVVDDKVHVLIGGSLYQLFTGTSQLTIQYKSPVFTEGSHSETKVYNNIYIALNGNFTIKVYLDEVLRLTKAYTTIGVEIEDIKLPQKYQRAKSLQLEITGTGTVYEYEYKTTGRQNGK